MTGVIDAFRTLHADGIFVMPNPWDVGTARWLRGRGFPALATTSAGFAFTQGRADQDVPLEMMLAHIADIVAAVPDLPVNADFENGYADDPAGVAVNVKRCVATGVAGLSIEDATGREDEPLYPFELALERVKAARIAIDESGSGVLLTARAECFLTSHPDPLAEATRRIAAFAEAGADVLYAPGLRKAEEFRAVVAAAGGRPVNALMFGALGHTVTDLERFGIRRVSIGAALARAAWAAFMRATDAILAGSFEGFAGNGRSGELNGFFTADLAARENRT